MTEFFEKMLGDTIIKGGEHIMNKFYEMDIFAHIISLIVALVGFAIGDFTKSMQFFILLQFIDVMTGFKKGKQSRRFSSGRLKDGAASKCGAWIYIIIGHAIDMMSTSGTVAVARTLVVSYLTIMELTSIAENAEEISGVKAPTFISKYLAVAKRTLDSTTIENNSEER